MERGTSARRRTLVSRGSWASAAVGVVAIVVLTASIGVPRGVPPQTGRRTGESLGSLAGGVAVGAEAVVALARLEPASGVITIGARPGARIEQILVSPGDRVTVGQQLAILEGYEAAQIQLALAIARKEEAEFQRKLRARQLALQRDLEGKIQRSRIQAAPRVLKIRQRFEELEKLHESLRSSLEGRERFDLDLRFQEAELRLLQLEQEVAAFQAERDLTPDRNALEAEEVKEETPISAIFDRQIELARLGVQAAEVAAPADGQVLELLAHAGEVSGGPLMVVGDVSAMVAQAEVDQSDVPRLQIGDAAAVQILETRVSGRVTRIGSTVGRNRLHRVDPRDLQDRRVVQVTISLNEPEPAARFVNMEVEVEIRPGTSATESPPAASAEPPADPR